MIILNVQLESKEGSLDDICLQNIITDIHDNFFCNISFSDFADGFLQFEPISLLWLFVRRETESTTEVKINNNRVIITQSLVHHRSIIVQFSPFRFCVLVEMTVIQAFLSYMLDMILMALCNIKGMRISPNRLNVIIDS